MPLNVPPLEPRALANADRIRPEDMFAVGAEGPEPRGCILHRRAPAGIRRIGQYAHQRVFSQWTGRPAMMLIDSEPCVSRLVVHVGGVEKCDQDVDVE